MRCTLLTLFIHSSRAFERSNNSGTASACNHPARGESEQSIRSLLSLGTWAHPSEVLFSLAQMGTTRGRFGSGRRFIITITNRVFT